MVILVSIEVFFHIPLSCSWKLGLKEPEDGFRLLLVADPQIQGSDFVQNKGWFLGTLFQLVANLSDED